MIEWTLHLSWWVTHPRHWTHAHRRTYSNTDDNLLAQKQYKLEMWANAQRDGRPAEYSWRPLFNAAKFG